MKHHNNCPSRFQKLGFPRYDGNSDPLIFINSCDTYFRRERIMEEEMVWMASCHLDDGARTWFLQVQEEGTPTWRHFTELLHLRFTSPPCPDLLHHVSPAANDTSPIFADIFTQLDRIKELINAKEKDHELRRTVNVGRLYASKQQHGDFWHAAKHRLFMQ